jgi:hypothetical protein
MIVCFVDIGEIFDDRCLNFPVVMVLYSYEADFMWGSIKKNKKEVIPTL